MDRAKAEAKFQRMLRKAQPEPAESSRQGRCAPLGHEPSQMELLHMLKGYRTAEGTQLKGLSKLKKPALLALCKNLGLCGSGGLLHLDHNIIRLILLKKAQTVGSDPSVLFRLAETCKTLRDILHDPADTSIWDAAWESYKASRAADGAFLDQPSGTARQRCLLLTTRDCSRCKRSGVHRPPNWWSLQRICASCYRASKFSDRTLWQDYGVGPAKLRGLPFIADDLCLPDWMPVEKWYWLDDIMPDLLDMYSTDDLDMIKQLVRDRRLH